MCCSSNWPIPIEADRLAHVQAAIANGELNARTDGAAWIADPGPPAMLASTAGTCVFHRNHGVGHACAIHMALGHEALPLACRQFPRVSLLDPRGASVVLSTYCPTAAAMLDTPGPVTIVQSPDAFPEGGEYVGLDARDNWPPILKPGVLMDWPSWWMFEARAVDLIANRSTSPDAALVRLSAIVEHVRAWHVGDGPLDARIAEAFDDESIGGSPPSAAVDSAPASRVRALHSKIPDSWGVALQPATPVVESSARQLRFLACHAFANWNIHLGEDIRAWLESLRDAHALLAAGFGVRHADLWLRHLTPATSS
jgi:hypothetical protein